MSLSSGTHWKGPLLGSDQAYGGIFEDAGMGDISTALSNYHIWFEDFNFPIPDASLAEVGATLTDINTATTPTEVVVPASGFLLINPGTKADSGSEVQFNAAMSQATMLANAVAVPGLITSTATLMDRRELFWACRFGLMSDTTAWDGKVMLGWITTDTTLMSNTTGLPTLATGGGLGFHIGTTGLLTYFGQQAALTVAGTATNVSFLALTTAAVMGNWTTVGFRCRFNDASAGTGLATFYINGASVGQISTGLPMASTEGYGVTLAVQNGPARDVDLGVDWMVTGISRPGITW
jgi:hypothetical protein